MGWTGPCLGSGGRATEKIWLVIEPIISFYLVCKTLKWLLGQNVFQRPSLHQLSSGSWRRDLSKSLSSECTNPRLNSVSPGVQSCVTFEQASQPLCASELICKMKHTISNLLTELLWELNYLIKTISLVSDKWCSIIIIKRLGSFMIKSIGLWMSELQSCCHLAVVRPWADDNYFTSLCLSFSIWKGGCED